MASQSSSGRAQWSVGSIEGDGIRYGLTIHAFTANTISDRANDRHHPVEHDPLSVREVREEPFDRAAQRSGYATAGASSRPISATVSRSSVREMLEHDALVADLLDLLQALDRLLDGPDRAVLAVASRTSFRARGRSARRCAERTPLTSRSSRPRTHGAISE